MLTRLFLSNGVRVRDAKKVHNVRMSVGDSVACPRSGQGLCTRRFRLQRLICLVCPGACLRVWRKVGRRQHTRLQQAYAQAITGRLLSSNVRAGRMRHSAAIVTPVSPSLPHPPLPPPTLLWLSRLRPHKCASTAFVDRAHTLFSVFLAASLCLSHLCASLRFFILTCAHVQKNVCLRVYVSAPAALSLFFSLTAPTFP